MSKQRSSSRLTLVLENCHCSQKQASADLVVDIEYKETLLREQSRVMEAARESIADYEGTVQQFRQLVANLQRYSTTNRSE